MDEEIERLVISVRADTAGFAKDVDTMQTMIDGPLTRGVERAGSVLGNSLSQAIRRGSLDLEDLRRTALTVMAQIAQAAISTGLGGLFGTGGRLQGSGLLGLGSSILGAALGAPGRATGGPVTAGRAYRVGEQGPETFVPTAAGRIEPHVSGGTVNQVRVTIHVSDHGRSSAPEQMQRSSRQVARAVRQALAARAD